MDFYLSTIDPNAHLTAKKYGLGLEMQRLRCCHTLDRIEFTHSR